MKEMMMMMMIKCAKHENTECEKKRPENNADEGAKGSERN